jgi:hypothetical protein
LAILLVNTCIFILELRIRTAFFWIKIPLRLAKMDDSLVHVSSFKSGAVNAKATLLSSILDLMKAVKFKARAPFSQHPGGLCTIVTRRFHPRLDSRQNNTYRYNIRGIHNAVRQH